MEPQKNAKCWTYEKMRESTERSHMSIGPRLLWHLFEHQAPDPINGDPSQRSFNEKSAVKVRRILKNKTRNEIKFTTTMNGGGEDDSNFLPGFDCLDDGCRSLMRRRKRRRKRTVVALAIYRPMLGRKLILRSYSCTHL